MFPVNFFVKLRFHQGAWAQYLRHCATRSKSIALKMVDSASHILEVSKIGAKVT